MTTIVIPLLTLASKTEATSGLFELFSICFYQYWKIVVAS